VLKDATAKLVPLAILIVHPGLEEWLMKFFQGIRIVPGNPMGRTVEL
jgi:hypothetical protein